MRILILTYGTRGDVQPFLALGQGLKARGHDVWLATSTRFESFIEAQGLQFCGLSDELLAILDTAEGKELMENTSSIFDAIGNNLRFLGRIGSMIRQQFEDSWVAAEKARPDLVLFHPKGFAGTMIAEKFGCPAVICLPFPMMIPTGETPHLGFPRLPFGSGYNRWTYSVVNSMAAMSTKGQLKKSRADHGLPPARTYSPIRSADGARLPSMTAVSPSVVPSPADWTETDRMTGYWFLEPEAGFVPSAELAGFLESGPPPVYIGFGSISGKDPARLARIAVEALTATGQRGILATGWGGLDADLLPDSILKIDAAPHDWLFPRMAAVVHHGGAGTTAAGLRAGKLSIITPFMGDQPYWGARVHELGAGPAPIPQKKLTVDNLSAAIREALKNSKMRAQAELIGQAIRSENGVQRAIDFLSTLPGCASV